MPQHMLLSLLLAAIISPLVLAAPAQQAEARKVYDSIFKAEEEAALKTIDRKDDAAFASKLLTYARELAHEKAEDRELKTILLLKAFEMGGKDPAGADAAIDAMQLLAQVNVEYKETAQENALKVRQMLLERASAKDRPALAEKLIAELMATGDDRFSTRQFADARRFYEQVGKLAMQVKASTQGQAEFLVRVADSRVKTAHEIDTLKAQHQAGKAAETAKKLVHLNLVEMDDVEEAVKFLDDARDDGLRRIVELCWKDVAQLTAAEAMELGDWLRPLTKTASESGRAVSIARAKGAYACRAGTTTPFHFGRTISTAQANYDGNSTYGIAPKGEYREKTTAVGSFTPNAWGLHDMHGNVWEWCSDWYDEYPKGEVKDPSGPRTGTDRVLRGGSWRNHPRLCRSAFRGRNVPGLRSNDFGFRVCLDVP